LQHQDRNSAVFFMATTPHQPSDDPPLHTQRVLSQWLSEIPLRPLAATYELSDRVLGSGGFGTVVVGRKRHLPQQVAIKRIHSHLNMSFSDQRRFMREVQLLAPLQHPNIVRVEDWGRDEQGLYIVMELIDGPNLLTVLERHGGPLPLAQVVDYGLQICKALDWAHRQGIVHRDLKPANLLLDPFGVVKLADFGLARRDPNLRDSLSRSQGGGYTQAYASPEQLEDYPHIDSRTDLYSLGATLYHLATNRNPLTRDRSLKAVPADLRPLLSSLLVDPEDRLPDVAAVVRLLSGGAALSPLPSPSAAVPAELISAQSALVAADGSCWKCQRVNALSRKFCSGCGSALYEACLATACQAAIGVWEAFCPECGADQPSLRQGLQQQTAELFRNMQQQLTQQRFDLARVTLQTVQQLLPTVRLQQLQPELPQLSAAIDQQQQAVQLVLDGARQLGEACQFDEALQCLQAIPQPLWPASAADWRRSQRELEQLQQGLPQLVQRGDLQRVREVHERLDELQPGRWPADVAMQQCVDVLVQRSIALQTGGDVEAALQCLEAVPTSERTAGCREQLVQLQQLVTDLQQQAEQLAGLGHYQQALDLLADLGDSRRPRGWSGWRSSQAHVQQLQVQLDAALQSEQLSSVMQYLGVLEGLQPGRWRQDARAKQLLDRLLTRCDRLLQQGTLDAAAALLQGIPASLHAERYNELQAKLQQRQAERALRELSAPFSAAAARDAQAAWAQHLGRAEEWTNTLGMKFRVIPAGTFLMGSPNGQGSEDEHPQHKVTITKCFGLGVHTVTQGQWQKLMGNTRWKGTIYVKEGSDIAATWVSWDDAVSFCRKLSESEGVRYRLPTEAEWEWSCRAGTTTKYSFGDDEKQLGKYAWYEDNAGDKGETYAHATGQKLANPYGLHDMHGNVWEWCQDWYDSGYYAKSAATDPAGPSSGSSRVLRGGSWDAGSASLRSANRDDGTPDVRNSDIGFRVVCELE
jgi:sulfatase modifying factor 1